MKKILSIFAVCAAFSVSSSAADEWTQDVSRLPEVAQTFIKANFKDARVSGIKIDRDFGMVSEFEAMLSDGTELEFDASGVLKSAKNKMSGVSISLLSKPVADYVSANYFGVKIKEFSQNSYGCEVELMNGLEIKFDASGKFIGLDS